MTTKNLTYNLTSGTLPEGYGLNERTGVISGVSTANYTVGGINSTFTVTATDGVNATARTFSITRKWYDGSTAALAGTSAEAIKAETGLNTDGVYYINLPTAGPTQIYCLMDRNISGGGWMMAMKAAATGNTFNFSANYWNTANTLNPSQYNRSAGDAKFHTMNYFPATDILALWPDITTNGGSVPSNPYGCWTWLQPRFTEIYPNPSNGFAPLTCIDFFGRNGGLGVGEFGTNNNGGKFICPPSQFPGYGQFSGQADIRFYGFNFRGWGGAGAVRWGFGWNENGEGQYWSPAYLGGGSVPGSNDVSAGIGMSFGVDWSAGDRINCCNNQGGINRQARVEVYVR